jgi:hypothetical protein
MIGGGGAWRGHIGAGLSLPGLPPREKPTSFVPEDIQKPVEQEIDKERLLREYHEMQERFKELRASQRDWFFNRSFDGCMLNPTHPLSPAQSLKRLYDGSGISLYGNEANLLAEIDYHKRQPIALKNKEIYGFEKTIDKIFHQAERLIEDPKELQKILDQLHSLMQVYRGLVETFQGMVEKDNLERAARIKEKKDREEREREQSLMGRFEECADLVSGMIDRARMCEREALFGRHSEAATSDGLNDEARVWLNAFEKLAEIQRHYHRDNQKRATEATEGWLRREKIHGQGCFVDLKSTEEVRVGEAFLADLLAKLDKLTRDFVEFEKRLAAQLIPQADRIKRDGWVWGSAGSGILFDVAQPSQDRAPSRFSSRQEVLRWETDEMHHNESEAAREWKRLREDLMDIFVSRWSAIKDEHRYHQKTIPIALYDREKQFFMAEYGHELTPRQRGELATKIEEYRKIAMRTGRDRPDNHPLDEH